MQDQPEDEIIELIDDDGKIVKFKLFDVTEYKNEKYALLLPAEETDAADGDEVLIFRYNEKESRLETVEDEELLEEVFDFYREEAEEEDAADGEN